MSSTRNGGGGMFCKYCGVKLTTEKCSNQNCPGKITRNDWFCETCGTINPVRIIERIGRSKRLEIIYRHKKSCEHCPPLDRSRWSNWAVNLCKRNPEKVIILSECLCVGQKQMHHPSYAKPFEVEFLCRACHCRKHSEILTFRLIDKLLGSYNNAIVY